MNLPKKYYKSSEKRTVVKLSTSYHTYFLVVHISPSYAGTLEDPPEPSETEIIAVYDEGFNDITEQINDKDFEELTNYLNK